MHTRFYRIFSLLFLRAFLFIGWGALGCYLLPAQVQIYRFIPFNFLNQSPSNKNAVWIQNTGSKIADISGYVLATRDYVFVFPDKYVLAPGEKIRLGKHVRNDVQQVRQISFIGHPNFVVRVERYNNASDSKNKGNYVALIRPKGQLIDAFYVCPRPEAPFLPVTEGECYSNKVLVPRCYSLPHENDPAWKFFPFDGEDPSVGFEQVNQQWRPYAVNSPKSIYAPTAFEAVEARYNDGVVRLSWRTAFEDQLPFMLIERGINPQQFQLLSRISAQGVSKTATEYEYIDNKVVANQQYFYRIRFEGPNDVLVESNTAAVETANEAFWWQVIPDSILDRRELVLRFKSRNEERIKIKLLDAQMTEVAILFYSGVYADTYQLLKWNPTKPLETGRYYLVATTGDKRYFKTLWKP
jgi:hypothetical protein